VTSVRSRVEGRVGGDEITLEIPAQGVYVVVLRAAIASMATRCELPLDEVYNLRQSIDEAALILLPRATPAATMRCELTVVNGRIRAAVRTTVTDTSPPDPTALGWMMLEGLIGEVDARSDGDVMTIEFSYPVDDPARA
jgi:serine/threonine-protein kinase RsbW